jgi:hypothetical protein
MRWRGDALTILAICGSRLPDLGLAWAGALRALHAALAGLTRRLLSALAGAGRCTVVGSAARCCRLPRELAALAAASAALEGAPGSLTHAGPRGPAVGATVFRGPPRRSLATSSLAAALARAALSLPGAAPPCAGLLVGSATPAAPFVVRRPGAGACCLSAARLPLPPPPHRLRGLSCSGCGLAALGDIQLGGFLSGGLCFSFSSRP